MKTFENVFDKAAIGLSFLCVAHCLLLPIALSIFPLLFLMPLQDELFHKLLVLAVLPISVIGLTLGCKKHKRWQVLAWGATGLTIIMLTALFGHDLVGELGEKVFTLIGSLVIAWGHVQNFRSCRSHDCH
ncbi:MerC mercury resistance protein [Sinobacterium caligoides]|uniref:MerC mercury resistance protein n=1 Tax=Sinobacterium caligoides TaxID=933926 RepID=A0A3N2DQF5_9GAMM|nr:MerC domain-containing protein [Sinobacterium caligoides]ROS02074.1 MerC mercury resistance protein [Sinobacterium caligoides]